MQRIAVAWESIQNCFAKYGFGIKDAVITEEDDQDNNDRVELWHYVAFMSF
jgi:hypothetical protein